MRVRELYGESETTDGLPGATLDSLTRMTGKIYEYDGSNGWQPRPVDQPLAANLPGHLWYKSVMHGTTCGLLWTIFVRTGPPMLIVRRVLFCTGEWCCLQRRRRRRRRRRTRFKLGTFGDKVVMAWETTETDALPPYHHQKGAMELFGKASEEPALGAGGKKQALQEHSTGSTLL